MIEMKCLKSSLHSIAPTLRSCQARCKGAEAKSGLTLTKGCATISIHPKAINYSVVGVLSSRATSKSATDQRKSVNFYEQTAIHGMGGTSAGCVTLAESAPPFQDPDAGARDLVLKGRPVRVS